MYRYEEVIEKGWGYFPWFVRPNVKKVKQDDQWQTQRKDLLQFFAEMEGVQLRATSSESEHLCIGNLSADHCRTHGHT